MICRSGFTAAISCSMTGWNSGDSSLSACKATDDANDCQSLCCALNLRKGFTWAISCSITGYNSGDSSLSACKVSIASTTFSCNASILYRASPLQAPQSQADAQKIATSLLAMSQPAVQPQVPVLPTTFVAWSARSRLPACQGRGEMGPHDVRHRADTDCMTDWGDREQSRDAL